MTPDRLSQRVAVDRIGWIETVVRQIGLLPLDSERTFLAEDKKVAGAESYSPAELYQACTLNPTDIETVTLSARQWTRT